MCIRTNETLCRLFASLPELYKEKGILVQAMQNGNSVLSPGPLDSPRNSVLPLTSSSWWRQEQSPTHSLACNTNTTRGQYLFAQNARPHSQTSVRLVIRDWRCELWFPLSSDLWASAWDSNVATLPWWPKVQQFHLYSAHLGTCTLYLPWWPKLLVLHINQPLLAKGSSDYWAPASPVQDTHSKLHCMFTMPHVFAHCCTQHDDRPLCAGRARWAEPERGRHHRLARCRYIYT